MAFLDDEKEIYSLQVQARDESKIWRKDYPEYERLADNDLLNDLDETLPEVNDGTLAAALFKLPKRIVNSKLSGRAKATDRDDAWVTELANMQWENEIIPNANSQSTFHRKWKDAVRKAAIYGSVPLITLFVERGKYTGADFIVAQPQDVLLEPGKVSDYDSDVIFWDVYYTKQQVKSLIERAKKENKEAKANKESGYNKWHIDVLQEALDQSNLEAREGSEDHNKKSTNVQSKGIKFCVTFQRGVEAPFFMHYKAKAAREWSNPDPSGDMPVHFLYCYQDFVNPYGVGIVKLAGGTQNVLDYMRQADVLATQLGFRPPISIGGDTSKTDWDSIVYAQDAQWDVGNAVVKREEISNQIYAQLPSRIDMYKSSLNNLLPMGDTSVGAAAGDPLQSKTPAGVKFAQANLSIDDDDFKDNLYMTYEAKARSLINTHFANMQGSDFMKLSDEEREILTQAGLEFPVDEDGNATNELEVIWDNARAVFTFEIEAEADKESEAKEQIDALLQIAQLRAGDPDFDLQMQASGKKLNVGELYSEVIHLVSDNEKIIEDISPEDQEQLALAEQEQLALAEQEAMAAEQAPMEEELPVDAMEQMPVEEEGPPQVDPEEEGYIQQIMAEYAVDEQAARFASEMEASERYSPEEIQMFLTRQSQLVQEPQDA